MSSSSPPESPAFRPPTVELHKPLAPAIPHIVAQCAAGPGTYNVSSPHTLGQSWFVKRGNLSLEAEARTQAYLFTLALSDPLAPGIARVHGVFRDSCDTYLLMDHVPAPSFRAWIEHGQSDSDRAARSAIAIEKIAAAVSWLLQCPTPGDNRIGPVGGGLIQHRFFNMGEAPVAFRSPEALEKFLDKASALTRLPGNDIRRVELRTEALIFSPSDITLDNFLYDPHSERVWMVDHQHVNVLPTSFFDYYIYASEDPFVQAVAAKIDFAPSAQRAQLRLASAIVIQSGNSSLGLGEDGEPLPRRRRPRPLT
ncbi:hypothetical protein GGX14DRAFT_623160 [Mycena pura]|uniref:Aminoglycoside phosphotransferase domain-containing protein n=1 Tax=Mycena pura TaxID=153505 RepID=A0AAD6VFT8_9AGAR|nr:hypothetical protein GGX14DRAFT_623160 [Mycena pura]